jgi:hypothetical protein
VAVGSPDDVLILNRDRDILLEPTFLVHRLEVVKLVPVADDPATRRQRGYPLLKEGQVGEHVAVRDLHGR